MTTLDTTPPAGPAGTGTGFVLNGRTVTCHDAHPHLLSALLEELDVTSPKDGCSPSGQCGCCTVLLDGRPTVSCVVPMDKVAGRDVTTLDGLDDVTRERYAQVFAATGALQCGFCTPGIVMRLHGLLERKGSALTRQATGRHLGGNLCRCTGYTKILDAAEILAAGTPVEIQPPGGIGSAGAKYEAFDLALGDRDFIDDMRVPGMLHAALRLTDHARADVTAIDTTVAAAVAGVRGVFTAADVPGELRVGIIERDWPVLIPVGGRTSYLGDVIAVVVADDRATALAAADLVDVAYDVLAPVTDPAIAVKARADRVGNTADDGIAVWGTDSNVLSRSAYSRGDVDAALAASAHVVEEIFRTQRIEHAFLEPESTLAVPRDDGGMHVYSGGQGVWDDRDQIASVLGTDPSAIRVELVSNGGAFGGKEDMSNQAQTALAAHHLGVPVKCTLTREQSFLIHAKRHPVRLHYVAGCDGSGRLTALRARLLGDSGAYASVGMKVMERAAGHASGPYRVPAIDVESVAARTNNPVCGAFRGFGANQAQFAMEGVMDRLAARVGIDAWEIRKRNVIRPGDVWGPGQVMDDGAAGAEACLDAMRPHWIETRSQGRAVGLGLGLKNSGLGNGFKEIIRAVVQFRADGVVEVRHCWTEMGQGVHTVAQQVAVEELGIDPDRIRVLVDTSRELGAGQTTGSRGTLMGAGAVADACRAALAGGCQVGVDYPGEYRVDWTDRLEDGGERPVIHSAFGYAAQLVSVDRADGSMDRVVAVHDVGRAVNPLLCVGQIEGAVHMGLGYACTEDFGADDTGRPTASTLRGLNIIRPKDMPPVHVELIEVPQPRAPYGIKGVGEIGLVPTAGAVAGALQDLDGEWRSTLPMGLPGHHL